MADEHDPDTLKAKLELEKLRHEVEKARLDVLDARRRWFQKPAYLAATAPLLIAALSAPWLWNFFSAKAESLSAKADRLQVEIVAFENRKEALVDSLAQLTAAVKHSVAQRDSFQMQLFLESARALELSTLLSNAVEELEREGRWRADLQRRLTDFEQAKLVGKDEAFQAESRFAKAQEDVNAVVEMISTDGVLSLQPNPSRGITSFLLSGENADASERTLSIFDALGRSVVSIDVPAGEMPI